MILHTVNKSPFQHDALEACLRVAAPEDSILLIEDGVYAAIAGNDSSRLIDSALGLCMVYVLLPDLEARGLAERVRGSITGIDYRGFVDLTAANTKVMSWF